MSHTFPTISALGTSWWIEVFDDIAIERHTVIYDDCVAFLRTFEMNYSRFADDSLVGKLNATGRITKPPAELQNLLNFGIDQYDRTNGVFNIMVGSKLVETGYDATYSFKSLTEHTLISNPQEVLHVGSDKIILDSGLVDIGGFGKGYAIDALARLLREQHDIRYFLINGGGDMYATSDHGAPLTIYLEHPTVSDTYLTTTTILNQGFAASSPHKRSWQSDGITYTHIINTFESPTGPEHRPDATFIKASTACTADIFATVALLVDTEAMGEFAIENELGVASFYLPDNSLSHNEAFI